MSPGFVDSAAMALAESIALPPPNPITTSQRSACACSTPLAITCNVGSPVTANVACGTARSFTSGAARTLLRPVTMSALLPLAATIGAASFSVPAPKAIRPTVANSNRSDIGVLNTAARLRHHGRHRIAPLLVVGRLLVLRRGRIVTIDFYQHKSRRVILLLREIKSRHARLAAARERVFDRRRFEWLDRLSFHMDLNVDY